MMNYFRRMFLEHAITAMIRYFNSYPADHPIRRTETPVMTILWACVELEATFQARGTGRKRQGEEKA